MRTDEWHRIEEALDAALELAPEERRQFLDEVGHTAPELRREVESLLACEAQSDSFLDGPALAFSADFFDAVAPEDRAGQTVGNYSIIREIGRGGMGAVFLAERADGEFKQEVALKVVRRSFADSDLGRRFRRERQILASLNHPNIARLLDGGVSADGEPFFAMEYVEGVRVDEYCEERQLSTRDRLKLFLAVCLGVSYAHQHLVVHRDLKPSNILVTPDGVPKLLDFGIAKLLDPEHAGDPHTRTEMRVFTPGYASPEQLKGEPVTTTSDVYSLGVLLGELLHSRHTETHTGRVSGGWKSKSLGRTVAGNRSTGKDYEEQKSRTKNEQFHSAELQNIVAMARREDPTRRYSSAALLAEDVQRFLDGRTVRAQKDSFTYRADKFIRRNKITVGALTLVAVSLVGGFAVALWQASVARSERTRAEGRFTDVRQLSNALLFDIAPKIERLEGSTEARESLVKRALEYLDSLARESQDDPTLQNELAAAYEKVGDLQGMPRRANLGDFNGAMASYEKSRQIRQMLLATNPNDIELRKNLAANLSALSFIRWWLSDVSGALVDSEKSLELYDKLLSEGSDSTTLQIAAAETRIDRADMFYFNDQIAETYPPLRASLSALEKLRQVNQENEEILRLLARGQTILALTLRFDNKVREGEVELAKAFAISEALAATHPHDPVHGRGLLYTYQQGSQFYQEVDDARAFEIQRKAVKVAEDAARNDAANNQARQNLAKSYSLMGMLAVRVKKLDEAVHYLERSAARFAELEKLEPQNRTYKHDIGRVLTFLGLAEYERHDFTGALVNYAKAVALYEDDARADPKNIFPIRKLAAVHTYIGDAHRDYAKRLTGQIRQTHLQAAKENHTRALEIFLQLEAQHSLAEDDRKYVEELRVVLAKYAREK